MRVPFLDKSPMGLSREEEQELAGVISNGAPPEEKAASVQRMVTANMRLALHTALGTVEAFHLTPGRYDEDLFGECLLAMTKSAWKFKPGRQRFSTYSVTAMRHACQDYLRQNVNPIAVPNYVHTARGYYEKLRIAARLETWEQMEQAGLTEKVYQRVLLTLPECEHDGFLMGLKHAVTILHAEERPFAEWEQEVEDR